MNIYWLAAVCLFMPISVSLALPQLSPSVEADAEYLLTTDDFTQPQMGMAVEQVEQVADGLRVTTTGAELVFRAPDDSIELSQRLGKARKAAVLQLPQGALTGLEVTRQAAGAVLLSAGQGALRMRINADSLLMLKSEQPLSVSCALSFLPTTVRQWSGNFLLLDEYGGIGTYTATGKPTVAPFTAAKTITHHLEAEQVLWVSVCPPKPYDWDASFNDRVVWHWSTETGYPTDDEIAQWGKHGNMLLQQAEMMLWKNWNLAFVPRFGLEEFTRVNDACQEHGMRNFVYTSPYYFLRGTEHEGRAINTFEGFTGWPAGDGTGQNWPIFLDQIKKVMREYKPDGLYFDGIYSNVVRTYLIARKSREVVGEGGILEYHATGSPPGAGVYLPQIDAYFNFILRGEGRQKQYEDPDYLRFFVSTYNISNSVGVLCNNNDHELTEAFINTLLDNNIRLHLIPGWLSDYRKQVMQQQYWPALDDGLRQRVQGAAERRQASAKAAMQKLREDIARGAEGLQPVFNEAFEQEGLLCVAPEPAADSKPQTKPDAAPEPLALPNGWQGYLSPNSRATFAVRDGSLRIEARAHTYSYLMRDLPAETVAVQCKLRGVAQFAMSWGPGILLWIGGEYYRIGLRDDDRIQVDHDQRQLLFDGFHHGIWYWLRLRIAGSHMLYEASKDGHQWRVLRADRLGDDDGPKRLAVGKVPFNGVNAEYMETGPEGLTLLGQVVALAPEG